MLDCKGKNYIELLFTANILLMFIEPGSSAIVPTLRPSIDGYPVSRGSGPGDVRRGTRPMPSIVTCELMMRPVLTSLCSVCNYLVS